MAKKTDANEATVRQEPPPDAAPETVTRKARKRAAMTQAEWEKVHNACVRSEKDPDPAQVTLLDAFGL